MTVADLLHRPADRRGDLGKALPFDPVGADDPIIRFRDRRGQLMLVVFG
jgi:hypothetical protein